MELKKARTEAGLTQVRLAREAGVGLATVRNVEQGGKPPGEQIVLAICGAVGHSPEEIDEFSHLAAKGAV